MNSAESVNILRSTCAAYGIHLERHLEKLGVCTAPDGRLERRAYVQTWRDIQPMLDDPSGGISLASNLPAGALSLLEWIGLSAPTLGEGLLATAEHGRLLYSEGHYRFHSRGDDTFFTYWSSFERPPRVIVDWSFGYLWNRMQGATHGQARCKKVKMQYARPDGPEYLQEVFGCEVQYDQPVNALVFDREQMGMPLITAHAPSHHALVKTAADVREKHRQPHVLGLVEWSIRQHLHSGDVPSLGSVARACGHSVRSLQRHLRDQGATKFSKLVDTVVMEEAAHRLLVDGDSVASIASELGYSDPSSFRRAFRRYHGVAPSKLVQQRSALEDT